VSFAPFIHSIIAMMMISIGIDRAVGRRAIDRDDSIHHPSTRRRVSRASVAARSSVRWMDKTIERKRTHPFVERSRTRGRRAKTLLTLEDEWTNARIDRVDAMTTG
tara:strand:+ start:4313 stop:4630 length:318 start_codon:yes stop_codon:yes gene_type:complete